MSSSDLVKILKLLFIAPFYAFFIWVDRYLFDVNKGKSNPFLKNRIPRTIPEIFDFSSPPQGKWLFDTVYDFLLQKEIEEENDIVRRKRLQFVSYKPLGGSVHEPDKSVVRVEIKYNVIDADEQRIIDNNDPNNNRNSRRSVSASASGKQKTFIVFVKLPTCRPVSLPFKAIVSTFSYPSVREVNAATLVYPFLCGVAEERGFGQDFKKKLFVVPRSIKADWSRLFDRTLLMSESVDMDEYHSNPDWMPLGLNGVHLMHDTIAYMHSITWRKVGASTPNPKNNNNRMKFDSQSAVTSFISNNFTEDGGADWLDSVIKLYIGKTTPTCQRVWELIKKRLASAPVALCHADFRGGNMLFSKDFKKMIITDWEANSIAPFMWDVTYSTLLGLTPEDRRKEQRNVVARYLKNLETNPHFRLNKEADQIPSLDECMELFHVCLVVLQYFGWVLTRFGGVGEVQGNSDNDVKVWEKLVLEGLEDVLQDPNLFAKLFSVTLDEAQKLIAGMREDGKNQVGCFAR